MLSDSIFIDIQCSTLDEGGHCVEDKNKMADLETQCCMSEYGVMAHFGDLHAVLICGDGKFRSVVHHFLPRSLGHKLHFVWAEMNIDIPLNNTKILYIFKLYIIDESLSFNRNPTELSVRQSLGGG